MTKIETIIGGIYPKSDDLRLAIGRWERGVIDSRKIESDIVFHTEKFDSLAEGVVHTEPLYNWYDIFRPLISLIDGANLGPLTRFEETNTFYRIPEFEQEVSFDKDPFVYQEIKDSPPLPIFKGSQESILFFPGPLTVAQYSRFNSGISRMNFIEKITEIMSAIAKASGKSELFLMERVPLRDGYSRLIEEYFNPGQVYLFTSERMKSSYFEGQKGKFRSIITDPNRENIEISRKFSVTPGVKIIESHNTRIEEEEHVKSVVSGYDVDRIFVTPDDYLDFLPRKVADRKLELLQKVGEIDE